MTTMIDDFWSAMEKQTNEVTEGTDILSEIFDTVWKQWIDAENANQRDLIRDNVASIRQQLIN